MVAVDDTQENTVSPPKPELDPNSATAQAAAKAASAEAQHVSVPDEDLVQVWTEIAGGSGTLSSLELRVVFQRLGREMSDKVCCTMPVAWHCQSLCASLCLSVFRSSTVRGQRQSC